ncbi:MAG: heparin lyase I family protein [Solirubrobacteraceae bacterium]
MILQKGTDSGASNLRARRTSCTTARELVLRASLSDASYPYGYTCRFRSRDNGDRHSGQSHSDARCAKNYLTAGGEKHKKLITYAQTGSAPAATPSAAPATGFLGSFEPGNFSEFDSSATSAGAMAITTERAYEGTRSAKITSDGSLSNSFQRVQQSVSWSDGSDVWYGMALYIPRLSDWCWWRPVRWDNYSTYGATGDVGGVRIEQGKLYLDQGWYGGATTPLIGPVGIPEGRWFWLEVHQKLSGDADHALSEVFLDGRKVGSSSQANSAGRAINHIRFGNTTLASQCSKPASIYYDRVSITDGPRGPHA